MTELLQVSRREMAEGKEVSIMSVEQAIQRELAYRKKIAYFLSEAEFAELLPLEVRTQTLHFLMLLIFCCNCLCSNYSVCSSKLTLFY